MINSKAGRLLAVVAALFILVGVLIVVVRRKSESPPAIGPEPEELARIRLSQTENGYFLLHEAVKQLPSRPAGKNIGHAKGPVAELLRVSLEEDAPELAATIEASRPAVKMAREALRMDYLLAPIDWPRRFYADNYKDDSIEAILSRIFLLAVQDARTGANVQESVQGVLDHYRLYWKCIDGLLGGTSDWFIYHKATLVRACPPQVQDELLPALLELRAQWQPPKYWLDTKLRCFETTDPKIIGQIKPRWEAFFWSFRMARARRLIGQNLETVRKVSEYGILEYREWEKHNRRLATVAPVPRLDMWLDDICRFNSTYLLELDSLCAVLALEKYKRDRGEYAPSLEDLVPAYLPKTPIDPYTGRPLAYRPEGDDYRLYSVGSDGKDNGGHPSPEEWTQDIFIQPAPAI